LNTERHVKVPCFRVLKDDLPQRPQGGEHLLQPARFFSAGLSSEEDLVKKFESELKTFALSREDAYNKKV
jgi:hypothetical protein